MKRKNRKNKNLKKRTNKMSDKDKEAVRLENCKRIKVKRSNE